jgi:hypothetical protein
MEPYLHFPIRLYGIVLNKLNTGSKFPLRDSVFKQLNYTVACIVLETMDGFWIGE